MTQPAVSVIIASYNYERYLEAAVRSALEQTWRDLEVLVVDDGSSDRSLDLARGFAQCDPRVRVLRHPDGGNHGLPATLRLGLKQAQGVYTAFLESDDQWRSNCLSARLATGGDVVFNAVEPLSMPGAHTEWFDSYVPRIMAEHRRRAGAAAGGAFALDAALLVENKIPTFSCIMARTALLRECSFDAPVPRWLDWWLWVQLAQRAAFQFVPEPLTLWRLHAGSYNHRIAFSRYLADSAAQWRGFRARLRPRYREQGRRGAVLLLGAPFWVRLFLRFGMIAASCGPLETIRRIRGRLR